MCAGAPAGVLRGREGTEGFGIAPGPVPPLPLPRPAPNSAVSARGGLVVVLRSLLGTEGV